MDKHCFKISIALVFFNILGLFPAMLFLAISNTALFLYLDLYFFILSLIFFITLSIKYKTGKYIMNFLSGIVVITLIFLLIIFLFNVSPVIFPPKGK